MQDKAIILGHKETTGYSLIHQSAGILFSCPDEIKILYIRLYMIHDIIRETWDPSIYKEIKSASRRIYLKAIGRINQYPIRPDDLFILEEKEYIKVYGPKDSNRR